MKRPIYRSKDEWVLCTCNRCGSLNYVEPHGTTATCQKCRKDTNGDLMFTEHSNIPYEYLDASGFWLIKKPDVPA